MDDKTLIYELNKILTLEHGHLGMYRDVPDHADKEIRRTFRRFTELEAEHIEKISGIIRNLGAKPSILVEGGDIIGKLFGLTLNLTNHIEAIKSYSFIEKKSHQGYYDFISTLEESNSSRNQFIAEMTSSNMLEAKLMHLWLEDKLNSY